MKKIALIIAVVATTTTSALAADIVTKSPSAPAPVWRWTGFYIGIDAGYTWNKIDISVPAVPSGGTATANPNSGTFGGHVGYLYHFNNPLVIGLEGDISWLKGNANGPFSGFPTNGVLTSSKWDASARACRLNL